MPAESPNRNGERPHVVIVGAGFGGLSAAVGLARSPVDVTVVDRRNYHLFQPLLYQVATAGLSPADIAAPVRHVLRDQRNAEVVLGEVTGVDPAARRVELGAESLDYDYLIIGTGARHAYVTPEWERHAPGLKDIEDATAMRARILLAFERAETSADAAERQRLMTFVVVGGGPTGVELAGAIAELAKRALARDFRRIDPSSARVVLLEGAPRLLTSFPEALSAYAARALARLGVEVRCDTFVERVDAAGVKVADEDIGARTVIWAAGVQASPAAAWLGAAADRAGRVEVDDQMRVANFPGVFVIGDTAVIAGRADPLPGVAPVAKQQGAHVARLIHAAVTGKSAPAAFRYRDYGNMATIGRSHAAADFGWLQVKGYIGWLLWCLVHIFFLIGFRNKIMVMAEWAWAYVTFQKGMRLITGKPVNADAGADHG